MIHKLRPFHFCFLITIAAFSPLFVLPPNTAASPNAPTTPDNSIVIYDDQLASNWSSPIWGDATVNPNATSEVYRGQFSMQVVMRVDRSDARTIALRILSAENLDPAGYESVSFYVYGTQAGQTIDFEVWDSVSITLKSQTINLPHNEWVQVEVPLDQLETEWELQAFVFRNASSAAPFYLDDFEITPKAPIGTHKLYLPMVR